MMSSASGSGCSTPDTLYIFGNQPQVNENRSNIDENLLQSSEGGTTERSASPAADALSLLYEPTTEDQSKPETSTSDIFFGSDLKQEGLTSTPVAQRCTDRSVINNESKSSSVNLSQGPDCTSTDLVLNTVDTNPTADCSVDNTDGLKQHSRVEHVSSLLGGPQNGGTSGTPASDSPATYNSMGSGVESESSDMERECSLTSSFTQTYHNLHETLTVPIVGFEVMEERARFTLTCQYSAPLAYTFTSVCTTACPKLQSPETCCLFLKIPHLLRMKNCSRHADLFIRQFARAITSKVFKVHVKMGPGENWFIFRRYTDFVRLNEKLTVLFPHFRLALPPKRWFGDNFDNNFLEDRQLGLQAFLNNVTSHKDICLSKPVREFLCLDDPPGRHDTLEESKALCESLEDDMYHLQQDLEDRDRRISLLEQELDLQRMEIVNLKKALKSEKLGRHSISSSTEHLVEADQQRYNSSKARDSKDNSPFKKSASKEKFQAEMNSPNRLSIIEISEECSSTESMTNATPVATS